MHFHTLAEAIDAMDNAERGFHFTSQSVLLTSISFLALRDRVQQLARKLLWLGHKPGAPVVIICHDQVQFLQLFLAAIRAGLVAVPMPPPSLTGDKTNYCEELERVRNVSRATHILVSDSLYQQLKPDGSLDKLMCFSEVESGHEQSTLPTLHPANPVLIQFTSGSTGSPKGIELSHTNVISNANAIRLALSINPAQDTGASWLPFHHDMGLMGFLILPVLLQASTWFMQPIEFARRPQRWLDLLDQSQATISFAPNFAYDLVARSIKSAGTRHWDLSCWRVAGCGGEPVNRRVLARFARHLAPSGFSRAAFAPSYGLAEATVAVTITRHKDKHRPTEFESDSNLQNKPVSTGLPIQDTDIRIVSESNESLPEGQEGEIQVRGPGVALRQWRESGPQPLTSANGWLQTGDTGYLLQGELHVCGRIKETILINGCTYYAHDLEECLYPVVGIRLGGVVAFARQSEGSEQLVIVAENYQQASSKALQRKLRTTIRQHFGLAVADVVIVDRGTITRTTSGKIKRHALKLRYLAGELHTRQGSTTSTERD